VRYLFTSLGFWILFNGAMLVWHKHFEVFYFREPYILALTHLAALGWLTTGFMGVMYATLPATLGVRPHSLRMAHVQYWLQVAGITGLTLTMSLLPHARGRVVCGLLTLGALVIFVHNMAATVGRGKTWHVPEAHFVMAVFYLAITGLIGMSYVFYLNSGYVPQTMVSLKVHAHFAGLGWLALTMTGLTYKLLPLELGVDRVAPRWSLAASVLINGVFWGVFFSYAYDWPALRIASAALALTAVVCHLMQVRSIARSADAAALPQGGVFANIWTAARPFPSTGKATGEGQRHPSSLPYTLVSCLFGVVATLLALVLTAGVAGDRFGVEYAYGYVAGAGWFGLYMTGQSMWLIPLLVHDDASEPVRELGARVLAFPGQVGGTVLVTIGLLTGVSWLVALGASINLAASLLVAADSMRLYWAQPAMAER
jgi:hypothetical protein